MIDTPVATESMRNKGDQRTEAKQELLRRTIARVHAAGRKPVTAYF